MAKILYCKNKPIYNLETNEIYDNKLAPYYIVKNPCKENFQSWIKLRYSSGTNTLARMLRGLTFGQGNRSEINNRTYMLSFSDCYWLKDEDNSIKFEEVSPYFAPFWTGTDEYKSGAVPTLYVPGYINKEWRENGHLFKQGDNLDIELECIELCKMCNIPVEDGIKVENGIELINFTSPDIMLEQANASGVFDEEEFTDLDIIEQFKISGIQMLTIDAIIGNGDRHAGNFGFLKDANTGEILGMSPLYDFDHALDDKAENVSKIFMQTLLAIDDEEYQNEIIRICKIAKDFPNTIFSKRADDILNNY